MNIIHSLHLFSFLVCIYMAGYVLYKAPSSSLNRVCALLISCFTLWSIMDVFAASQSVSMEKAILLQNVSAVGWILYPGILLCFSLIFAKNEVAVRNKWFLLSLFCLPATLIYAQFTNELTGNPAQKAFGWEFYWNNSTWTWIYMAYCISLSLTSIYVIYRHGFKTTNLQVKSQARIMTVTLIVSLAGGTLTDMLLPLFGVNGFPQMANVIILVFGAGMIFSIRKFKFLTVTTAIAAEQIISTMAELMILLDNNGKILNVNNAVTETLKYEHKDLTGKSLKLIFGHDGFPDDLIKSGLPYTNTINFELLRRISQGDRIKNYEGRLLSKDLKEIPVILSCSALKNEQHEIIGTVVIASDITERKKAEVQLSESEGRVREKLNAILLPEGSISNLDLDDIIDIKTIQSLMNDFYHLSNIGVAILNLRGDVLVSTGWQDICTNFHRAHPETCKNCIESDTILNGNVEPGSFKIYKCRNNMWDVSTPIIIGKQHVGNLFMGQFLFDNEIPDYSAFRAQALKYGFDESEYIAALNSVPRRSEQTIATAMSFFTIFTTVMSTLSYSNIKLARTLEEQKRIEADLQKSKLKAEESERLKSAFLANMSHEIRTPMNSILGFAELLKDPRLSGDDQQEFIEIIEKSGIRMLNMITQILDISKIEAGMMDVYIHKANINEQTEYIFNLFKQEAEAKGIQLIINNTLANNEANIRTDREKLLGILTNLVKNALKFTTEGTIELGYNKIFIGQKGIEPGDIHRIKQSVEIRESNIENQESNISNHCEFIEFYVKDTGIGIPDGRHEAIFERFIQADISDKMAKQGAGLGLSISKAYVEMLGGSIRVENNTANTAGTSGSTPGSTFYFTLPIIKK